MSVKPVGRPKKYKTEEEKKLALKEHRRNNYKERFLTKDDLIFQLKKENELLTESNQFLRDKLNNLNISPRENDLNSDSSSIHSDNSSNDDLIETLAVRLENIETFIETVLSSNQSATKKLDSLNSMLETLHKKTDKLTPKQEPKKGWFQ
jgi:hypothetical protein